MSALPLGMSPIIEYYGDPKMLGISNVNNTYANLTAAKSTAGCKAWVDTALSMHITQSFQDLEATKPEAVTESTGFGANRVTRFTPGGIIVYLDSNPWSHNSAVKNFTGGRYYCELYLGSGHKLLHKNSNGTYCGFLAQASAVPTGIPGLTDKTKQYTLRLDWENVDQFKDVEIVELVDPLADYLALNPTALGYTMVASTYAATNINITLFALADKTALVTDTLTATIIDSYDSVTGTTMVSAAVTVGAPSSGVSALTITKGSSPVTLVSGDWIKFKLHKKTSAIFNTMTEIITLKVP